MVTASPSLELPRLAAMAHALSDETRLSVLEVLSQGERCVCDLQSDLDVAQSRLSFHLRVLRDAGLVTDRREGRWSYYTLSAQAVEELHDLVVRLRPRPRRLPVHQGKCCG